VLCESDMQQCVQSPVPYLETTSELFSTVYDRNGSDAAPYSAAWFHLSDCIGRLVDPADKELLYKLLSSLDMDHALDHHPLDTRWSLFGPFKHIGRVLLWYLQEVN